MRALIPSTLIGIALVLLAACSAQRLMVAETVGPYEPPPRSASTGFLVVYSDLDRVNDDPAYYVHSEYQVERVDGSFAKSIANDRGPTVGEPPSVTLPVGEYRVRARSARYGMVEVKALIKANQATVIDLNSEVFSTVTAKEVAGKWVRLPRGEVLGVSVSPR